MLRFDHFRLAVADLARSRRWYVDTLGMKVEFDWGCGAELTDPDGHAVRLWDERTMKEK